MKITFDTRTDSFLGTATLGGTQMRIYNHMTNGGESHYYGHVSMGYRKGSLESIQREKAVSALLSEGSDITKAGAALFGDIEEV